MYEIGTTIEIITNILTGASIITAAVWYIFDRIRGNRIATLEAYDRLQREVLDEINLWSVSEIREAMEDRQSDAYKKLSAMLARIEHFCAGINTKIYDFDIFYSVAHGYFDYDNGNGMLYRRIIPIIERKSEESKEDYFANIHKVWDKMEKKAKYMK